MNSDVCRGELSFCAVFIINCITMSLFMSVDDVQIYIGVIIIRIDFISENGSFEVESSPCSSTVDEVEERSEREDALKRPKIAPGFFFQLWVFMRRETVLQLRMYPTLLLDQAWTLIAGSAVGLLFREVRGANTVTMKQTSLRLTT